MDETFLHGDLVRMLQGAIRRVQERHEDLSRLDSVGGDGDHGTTMMRAMGALEKAADAGPCIPGVLLRDAGWAILGIDGGATGPLFGMLFLGMSEALGDRMELGPADLAAAFEAGLASVQKRTKAKPGDKTMLDALVPAVEALRAAAAAGAGIPELLRCAAEAAERGAVSTQAMAARFGRARNVGEKSIGSQDPGATSVSLILRGFFEGIDSHG